MPDPRTRYTCPGCGQVDIGATLAGKLRSHKSPAGVKCAAGANILELPPEGPPCNVTRQQPVSSATCSKTSAIGGPTPDPPGRISPTRTSPETSGVDTFPENTSVSTTPIPLPGVDTYVEGLSEAHKDARVAAHFATQFDQPSRTGRRAAPAVQPMTPLGAEIAARMKELFHGYSNRDDRSQQATLGPSEIGTPCDRRIALSLLRYPPVNPGGDNWASFIGTQMHAGLDEMLVWANAGSGRYATEQRLTFPSKHVPQGTTDVIDRTLFYVGDHKGMGQWSLDKLKTSGPSNTYRVQAHTYAYGASMRGEKVKHVAIIGWPRDKGNLDDLYVWTEPYDPKIARDALARVDGIADAVLADPSGVDGPGTDPYSLPMDNSDCRYCPFYLKGAAQSAEGVCNGRN